MTGNPRSRVVHPTRPGTRDQRTEEGVCDVATSILTAGLGGRRTRRRRRVTWCGIALMAALCLSPMFAGTAAHADLVAVPPASFTSTLPAIPAGPDGLCADYDNPRAPDDNLRAAVVCATNAQRCTRRITPL